jgi:hypothetical protein
MNTMAAFEDLCRKTFRFLQDNYGFKVIGAERERYGVFVTYANPSTGVRISYEPRAGGIFVLLGRLSKGGELPRYPIFIHHDTPLEAFHLDDLLSIRAPDLQSTSKPWKALTVAQVETKLHELSETLQHHASDILQGDFAIFPELEKLVKARQRRQTQKD